MSAGTSSLKILVTGSSGQVATKLASLDGVDGVGIVCAGRPVCDIKVRQSIIDLIEQEKPDVVVNAAAYTAVDKAEDDRDAAFAINRDGAGNVAAAAAQSGLPIIHISTDYVFPGDKAEPYVEEDETGPTGVYGQSKLEGEHAVARENAKHLIFRTAWVYSDHGHNFVKSMLRFAKDRDELTIVADQQGNPTSASDLAKAIIFVAGQIARSDSFDGYGVYHLTGTGSTHWAGFAQRIMEKSREMGGHFAEVREITTAEFPTPAKRPENSRLSNRKFIEQFGWKMPEWMVSCDETVELLVRSGVV